MEFWVGFPLRRTLPHEKTLGYRELCLEMDRSDYGKIASARLKSVKPTSWRSRMRRKDGRGTTRNTTSVFTYLGTFLPQLGSILRSVIHKR